VLVLSFEKPMVANCWAKSATSFSVSMPFGARHGFVVDAGGVTVARPAIRRAVAAAIALEIAADLEYSQIPPQRHQDTKN